MNEDEKRLRKKMRKLYSWAKKHGYVWVDICIMGPDKLEARWYANGTVGTTYVNDPSAKASEFYDEGSDDE